MMKSTTGFVLLILIICCSSAEAQVIRNLNFDQASIVNPELPFGWNCMWIKHTLSLDSTAVISGKYSFQSRQTEGSGGYGLCTQGIPSELIRGKKLHITARIRTKNITKGNATLRLRLFDKDWHKLKFITIPAEGLTGTNNWKEYTIKSRISDSVALANIDLWHPGNGQVWVDDIKLFINEKKYSPKSFKPWNASDAQVQWLRQHIIPLKTDDPLAPLDDLNQLQLLMQGAKIIGLGENTHGTREFFRLKHRLMKWMATQNDTLILAMEANMPEARLINEYVLNGEGNPKELLPGLHFWTWNTQEVLNVIRWVRQYNASGRGRITFWGFDMQYPQVAADSVQAFIRKAQPSYYKTVRAAYDSLQGPYEMRRWSEHKTQKVYELVAGVLNHLENNRSQYHSVDSSQVVWAVQYAHIVQQSVERCLDGNLRDKSMAQNIEWIDKNNPSASRIMVWAHNLHVERGKNKMGFYLDKKYGEDYRPIAFGFGQGSYSAVLGPNDPVKSFPAPAPIEGSVEHVLHQLKEPIFAMDLREAKKNSVGHWLMTPKKFRNIGSIAKDLPYYHPVLANDFDGLIYVDEASASHVFGRPKN